MSEFTERLPRGPKGDKGEPGMSRGARRGLTGLLVLMLLLGGANLLFTSHYVNTTQARFAQQQAAAQAIQRRAGQAVERAICDDIGTMAALRPPAGSAVANPSRAYEQAEHRAWSGLYAGLGCMRRR